MPRCAPSQLPLVSHLKVWQLLTWNKSIVAVVAWPTLSAVIHKRAGNHLFPECEISSSFMLHWCFVWSNECFSFCWSLQGRLQCHCIVSRLPGALCGQNMTSLAVASHRGPCPLHHHQTMAKLDNTTQSSACCQRVFVPFPKKMHLKKAWEKNQHSSPDLHWEYLNNVCMVMKKKKPEITNSGFTQVDSRGKGKLESHEHECTLQAHLLWVGSNEIIEAYKFHYSLWRLSTINR